VKTLRETLPRQFPGTTFSFLPADIISQILNFGAPAPIDLQVAGPNAAANRAYAAKILARLKTIRGLADVRMQQPAGAPQLRVDVDRSRIAQLGLTERDVTNSMVTSLAGSSQVAPTFWLNPKNGVSYPIVAQVPEYRVNSMSGLEGLPITGPAQARARRSSAA
jgi:multidrug efflux pump subunit AcrB